MTKSTRPRVALIAAFSVLLLPGCSPVPEFGEMTVQETYDIGSGALETEDYLVATEAFKTITSDSPMHELADDALLGLADAYRLMGDYAMAEEAYVRLAIEYPRSPLAAEAQYKLGLSYYEQSPPAALDQQMTRRAIEQLQAFVDSYPDSTFAADALEKVDELRSRLAKKDFENGMLYVSLDSPDAARVYFQAVADEFGDTIWGRRSLLEIARSYRDEGSTAEAAAAYERVVEEYPGTEEAQIASVEAGALGR